MKPDKLAGMRGFPILTFSLLAAGIAAAQAPDPGRIAFESRCARCHGGDGTGGESGPNIVSQIDSRNDADTIAFLRAGRPASGMPAFNLAAGEMNNLVRYLRTL